MAVMKQNQSPASEDKENPQTIPTFASPSNIMCPDNTVLPVVEEVLRVCSETNVLKFIENVWYRIYQFKGPIS